MPLAGSRFLLIHFPWSGTADTNFPAGVQGYVLAELPRWLKF
jgi:hypothetical protein